MRIGEVMITAFNGHVAAFEAVSEKKCGKWFGGKTRTDFRRTPKMAEKLPYREKRKNSRVLPSL